MTCECKAPGWCERFQKFQYGRQWDLCHEDTEAGAKYRAYWQAQVGQPKNASNKHPGMHLTCPFRGDDLRAPDGSAVTRDCPSCGGLLRKQKIFHCNHPARNEDVTVKDCSTCPYQPRARSESARKLILVNRLSPGDVLAMTATVESLHRQFPGQFVTAVRGTAAALWEFNPWLESLTDDDPAGETIEMHYPLVNRSNQLPVHFLEGYCRYLGEKLGVPLTLQVNRPCLYLSREEREWMSQVKEAGIQRPFWLVNAGVKSDYTAKQWPHYQRLVDLLQGEVLFVQIGEASHRHPTLRGVLNFVGKTDLRQLIRLAWHAHGGVGPSTLLQHLMAAWEKPYVCLLGGREPAQWVQYPKQQTLHTLGALSCCRNGACWKSRVVKLGDGDKQDQSLCEQPCLTDPPAPRCLAMIPPERVADLVRQYLRSE